MRSRQQVLKWVLKETSVLRLVSNPVCSVYMQATGCGCFLRAAAKCQTMCVSNSAQGKVKPKKKGLASTPTYLFFVVLGWLCRCVFVCVCFAWVSVPPETLRTGACLTGSQICVYSRLLICFCCFFFSTLLKQQKSQAAGKYSPPSFFPLHTLSSKYCTLSWPFIWGVMRVCPL